MRIIVCCCLLLLAKPVAAQRAVDVSPWVTELAGGAVADLFARGPWIAPSWRRSFVARVGLATGLSVVYEYVIEPWNGQTNAAVWQDVAQRFVGTIALEGAIALTRRIL